MTVLRILVLGLFAVNVVYTETAKPLTLGGGSGSGSGSTTLELQEEAVPLATTNGGIQPTTQHGSAPPLTLNGGSSTGSVDAGLSDVKPGEFGPIPFAPLPQLPVPPLPSSFEFNKLFEKYFQTLNADLQELSNLSSRCLKRSQRHAQHFYHSSARAAVAFPPWNGYHTEWHKQVSSAHQAAVANLNSAIAGGYGTGGYGYPGGFPAYLNSIPGSAATEGNGAVGASATGLISPEGSVQTANLYPEVANKPNVFAQSGPAAVKPGETQFYSVQTSSVAGSSDINGQKTSFRKAQTTVNDNGKVSTYNLGDP